MSENRRVECPRCGSPTTICKKMGRDVSDTYSLRLRLCRGCRRSFTTAEVPVLDSDGEPVAFGVIDVEQRAYHREWQRRRRGYQGGIYHRPIKSLAQLDIDVTVRMPSKRKAA